jgi:hypothetical protein
MRLLNWLSKPKLEDKTPDIDRSLLPAWHAASVLVRFLESRKERKWAATFGQIERALACGDPNEAIRLFEAVPMVNMGSFSDLLICRENGHRTTEPRLDNDILLALHSQLWDAIRALRGQQTPP